MVIRNERPNRSSQADTINYADLSPEEVEKALVGELHLFIMGKPHHLFRARCEVGGHREVAAGQT